MNLFLMSKSSLSPIEKEVQSRFEANFSNVGDPRFVLAVSGGQDSMALLHIFNRLGISAIVAHVNYQKRGAASDKDAELVREVCAKWGFDCHIRKVDPQKAEGENFQQWARKKRYEFFRELKATFSADGIAVAHHEDDQAETILQKIFRGSGLASWSGMKVWDGELLRPLLRVSRQQIEKYVAEHNVPYREDETNLQSNFARNLLRNEWLDELSEFFPGWKQNVLRIEQQAEIYEQSLKWISQKITDEHGIRRSDFDTLDSGLQQALVLFLIKQEYQHEELSRDSLKRVAELNQLQPGKELVLSEGISLVVDRDHYVLKQDLKDFEPVKLEPKDVKDQFFEIDHLRFHLGKYENPDFEHSLYLDEAKLRWPVTIRRWQKGDEFQPLGMQGHQLISDHLTNRKVSSAHKDRALVVESFEETICAIIFPPIKKQMPPGTISEQVKCDDETNNCLVIKYRN